MLLLEGHARLLLVLHAVLGAATVAVTSHLFVWTWRLVVKNQPGRQGGVRWFAVVGFALYAGQFALGNLMYPVYKVRVRGEFLEQPAAVLADGNARRAAHAELYAKVGARVEPDEAPNPSLAGIAHLFDIKEHWIALGLPLLAAAWLLAFRWDPRTDGRSGGRLLLYCSGAACVLTWFGAIVGLVVTSYRSIGAP